MERQSENETQWNLFLHILQTLLHISNHKVIKNPPSHIHIFDKCCSKNPISARMIVFDVKLKTFFPPLLIRGVFNEMLSIVFTFVDQDGFFCGMEQMQVWN